MFSFKVIVLNIVLIVMARIVTVDYLRCIAFICMIIHHIYYIPKILSNNREIPSWVSTSGYVSRHIFIILVGVSLSLSLDADPDNFNEKQITRAIKILIHAFFISMVSRATLGKDKMILCGVLHFIGIVLLLFHWFAQQPVIGGGVVILLGLFNIYSQNNYISYVAGNPKYHMGGPDYFCIKQWLPVVLIGIVIGKGLNNIESGELLEPNIFVDYINKYCLELYTLHLTLLLLFYYGNSSNVK